MFRGIIPLISEQSFLQCVFLATLTFILFSGCVNEVWFDGNRFGYHYTLIENDSLPRLSGDTLFVAVGYSGCNPGHRFEVRYSFSKILSAEVWLFKSSPDQLCDAYFEEVKVFILPRQVSSKQTVTLVGPNGEQIALKPQ
jgi:hypothetical protein